ncbi:hypothetical protein B0T26DRAFT_802777 [Lasiosphaeria miniovina]|uniref:ubiquitinyl hydrolase 1 n=1 Tax=Lasiosphaeria miniovina TaxID=1954250 RepID=A0AA40AKX0_9PEZI|nr:uncharacterized protein B0T26DRAFT_802777 [Lasiosphaeria miniovina]KAK0717722.1 hypothetical protein B0T26DRAFT_802777 [Lasiosphaeria miniovina]
MGCITPDYWNGNGDKKTNILRQSLLFICQTGRHGPQNGFRLCVVHRGYCIESPTKVEGTPEDDVDRLEKPIAQVVVLGQAPILSDSEGEEEDQEVSLMSQFASHTYRCLVFLDQAHTRGTDLRLPDSYRPAVTLGAGVTKDTLAQEIQTRIRKLRGLGSERPLQVADVLTWSISETLAEIDRRYRPRIAETGRAGPSVFVSRLESMPEVDSRLAEIKKKTPQKCEEFRPGMTESWAGSLQEEQERELAPEIEEERQIERPAPRKAACHRLHEDVVLFRSRIYLSPAGFPSDEQDLLVTADFARTVVNSDGQAVCSDTYQRPVQWILTSHVDDDDDDDNDDNSLRYGMRMVVVSQWEADQLKSCIANTDGAEACAVALHAYLPQPSLTFPSLDDLRAYTVPPLHPQGWAASPELIMQLNLFAGQLCLASYSEYVRLCRFLGLAYTLNTGGMDIAADSFSASPVAFLNALYKRIRRDCVGIEKTHMGFLIIACW